MGLTDQSHQNGSEQIYLPVKEGGWLPSTKIITYDPSQMDVPGKSPGPAVLIAYGRGLGDPSRGLVMFEAGHSVEGNNAPDVAAQRAFFNWSYLVAVDKTPKITSVTGIPANGFLKTEPFPINYPLTVTFNSPVAASFSKVKWTCTRISDGTPFGTFSVNDNMAAVNTIYTPPATTTDIACIFTVAVF